MPPKRAASTRRKYKRAPTPPNVPQVTPRPRKTRAVAAGPPEVAPITPDLYVQTPARLNEAMAGVMPAEENYAPSETPLGELARIEAQSTLPGQTVTRGGGNVTYDDAHAMQEAIAPPPETVWGGPGTPTGWQRVKQEVGGAATQGAYKAAKKAQEEPSSGLREIAKTGARAGADALYSAGGAAALGAAGTAVGSPALGAVGGVVGGAIGPAVGHAAEGLAKKGYGKVLKYRRVQAKHAAKEAATKLRRKSDELRRLRVMSRPSPPDEEFVVAPPPGPSFGPGYLAQRYHRPYGNWQQRLNEWSDRRSDRMMTLNPYLWKRQSQMRFLRDMKDIEGGNGPFDFSAPPGGGPFPPDVGTFLPQKPFLSQVLQGNLAWFDDLAPSGAPYTAKPRTVSTMAPDIKRPKGAGKWALDPNSGLPYAGNKSARALRVPRQVSTAQLVR